MCCPENKEGSTIYAADWYMLTESIDYSVRFFVDSAALLSIPIMRRVISINELLPVDVGPANIIIMSALCRVKHDATKA